MTNFHDRFSKQSDSFKRFRPEYPSHLYDFILSHLKETNLAWDCGCGNGQAAKSLIKYFNKVIATDASKEQIENALDINGVEFKIAKAEDSGIQSKSVDLITVATALHWFDKDAFYKEAKRVLKEDGVIAVWTYEEFRSTCELDAKFKLIYDDIRSYWSDKLYDARNKYETIEMPFESIETPPMKMSLDWNLFQCLGYLRTWSATQSYIDKNGIDPTEKHLPQIQEAWGDPEKSKTVSWKLHLKMGRNLN